MVDDPKISDPLDAYALAVGQLCNQWAQLETVACNMVIRLASMDLESPAMAMMRCYGFRDHLTAIKIGAVASNQNPAWIDRTVETVDYIENHLRNRRNRFVHDHWIVVREGPGGAGLVNYTPKVTRRKAHEGRVMVPGQFLRQELSEITETTEEIDSHRLYLAQLIASFGWPTKEPLPVQIATPPRRRFLPPHVEKPRPSDKLSKARARRPRSSHQ